MKAKEMLKGVIQTGKRGDERDEKGKAIEKK